MDAANARKEIERLKRKVAELKDGGQLFMPTTPYYADNAGDEADNEAEPVEDAHGNRFMPTKDPYDS